MTELEKVAFGMGCFWDPDALFGGEKGVVKTRVGYAGGEKENPTYQDLGNHTETVLVKFDPEEISYEELLEIFWENHNYTQSRKPQYASKIFYLNKDQKKLAELAKLEHRQATTTVEELDEFYVAEDYHQKYRLRNSELMEEFESMNAEEFRDSPLAAKANAVIAGHLSKKDYQDYK